MIAATVIRYLRKQEKLERTACDRAKRDRWEQAYRLGRAHALAEAATYLQTRRRARKVAK